MQIVEIGSSQCDKWGVSVIGVYIYYSFILKK